MSDSTPETRLKPFSITLYARWPDMDFNQHMRNAAYLGASEDCRMTFLAKSGFTMESFRSRRITFRRESDGAEAAIVESIVIWFDLEARRPIVPPEDLKNLWLSLAPTSDFEWYPLKAVRKQGA